MLKVFGFLAVHGLGAFGCIFSRKCFCKPKRVKILLKYGQCAGELIPNTIPSRLAMNVYQSSQFVINVSGYLPLDLV